MINLPSAGDVNLKVTNIDGQTLMTNTYFMNAGDNPIRLTNDLIDYKGVLIYEIAYGDEVIVQKMIKL
jgi:hypothetical protein